MSLERQSIEKKDFPIGRRGYEPDAVDAHLAKLADEIDELKLSSRRRSETLASAASEQVRAIVEAAESSAAEIQRQAEEEAREIRAEATDEARVTREQATGQAREYVGRVSETTAGMLQRLDAMESELSALIESLRTGSNRLNADLQLLEGNLEEVRGSVDPSHRFDPALDVDPEEPWAEPAAVPAPAPAPVVPEPEPEPELEAAVSDGFDAPVARAGERGIDEEGEDDTEGARLIALNMALNGTSREETDRYLAENFSLRNREELLDEVYASIEG